MRCGCGRDEGDGRWKGCGRDERVAAGRGAGAMRGVAAGRGAGAIRGRPPVVKGNPPLVRNGWRGYSGRIILAAWNAFKRSGSSERVSAV